MGAHLCPQLGLDGVGLLLLGVQLSVCKGALRLSLALRSHLGDVGLQASSQS